MSQVKFNYNNGRFWYRGASNRELEILGIFLATDIASYGAISYKKFALNPNEQETGGNATFTEKIGDKIIIEDAYGADDDDTRCELSTQQFLYILDTWKELYQLKPKEILITKIGDQFEVKGIY